MAVEPYSKNFIWQTLEREKNMIWKGLVLKGLFVAQRRDIGELLTPVSGGQERS